MKMKVKAKIHQSMCTMFPEALVVTDSEEDDIQTREMTAGSSNSLPSLPNMTIINKRKLEEDILFQRRGRELQILDWVKADLDKKSKRGPPHPGPG